MISTDCNPLTVPEIRNHCTEILEGVTITTYEQRNPEASTWHPVLLIDTGRCTTCGETVPVSSLSGGACIPCTYPAGD